MKIMKIVTLVENTCGHEGCIAEHGLSVYIETEKHKLLLDCGQTDAAVKNAEVLGIDLTAVDTVILSHGHYDHSGGIMPFSRINDRAQIIMQKSAAEPHYNGERYIGIDKDILALPNVHLIEGDVRLDDELFLFSGITGRRCFPQGNRKLLRDEGGEKVQDDFAHEQCLVIEQEGKRWLLSGCSHNGILNILDRYRDIFGSAPDRVITGFHMMKNDGEHTEEEKEVIIQTARELAQTDTIYYSGHCTGIPAFELMKTIMGDKLIALHSGEEVI
ncbi:7,8-dihydropterin-6-yl-methyl-4-(beta-D-ribofuranosyl)aminobenzene 5'-phosphate synthase [Ruminococcus albus]|uniref:7,8-dihydropterin-6-yl-methyl-4-(Beta-D-ribofuranosyl)aminobenzene 5'-phosphate synthase n=2 Tax=Ruminococcus albus TaxID=1264 RepID=A0A1H7GUB7_RUMAL|nr:7,8-dihydropterin-6-yl-methyl-4-(beta-D-ribofuranosyl)aminobenzene 5'-phosphate synthase [Ruminococcus albus]